ncbi:sulfotransferase family protein [Ekhidna sp.]|uniref:sulfotransferase family protein n=1 Tax=Ekhidna sp. TaxID=2608089 RepID=UPI003C7B81CD
MLPKFLKPILKTAEEIPPTKYHSPIFITGCMRSGTTFLVDKLSAHPQLFKIGVELNLVWEEIGGTETTIRCEYNDGSEASAYHTYQMTRYITDFISEGKSIKRHLMRWVNKRNKQTGRVFYDWDQIIPVNKSPHLINKILYVDKLFPKAKFIFIIRDIYSYSSSLKIHFDNDYKSRKKISFQTNENGACWSRVTEDSVPSNLNGSPCYPNDFSTIPSMWIRLNKVGLESLQKIDRNQYLVICYEDLIRHQERLFKEIFAFLNLNAKFIKVEESIAKRKVDLINTTSKGNPLTKWKKELTSEEKKNIDRVIENEKNDYEYVIDKLRNLKA